MTDLKKFSQAIKDSEEYELFFYEELLKKHPDFTEVFFPLAEQYTHTGKYDKGLEIDIKLTEAYPDDNSVWYNLACSYTLCGKFQEAVSALEKALELKFDDMELISSDSDLDNLRNEPAFINLMEKYFPYYMK